MLSFSLQKDEFSKLVQQWNTQRSQALERALTKILYPQMEKEIRAKLLQEGRDFVLRVNIPFHFFNLFF